MRKILSFVLAALISTVLFGCSMADSTKDSVNSAQSNNSVTSEVKETVWTEIEVSSLREIENYFHINGFPEVMLQINEEYLGKEIKVSTNDNIIKMSLTYSNYPWTIYAVKVDGIPESLTLNIPGIPPFNINHDMTEHLSGFVALGLIMDIYDNGVDNVFVCHSDLSAKDLSEVTELPSPKLFYFNNEMFGQDGRDCNTKDREHLEFLTRKEMLNGEEITMTFRCGTTWAQWANSELNTGGWFISEFDSFVVLNADKTAFLVADDIAGWTSPVSLLEPSKHPWYTQVLDEVQNGILVDGKMMIEDIPTEPRNRFIYCRNSYSPLCVEGFKISAMESESDYTWETLSHSFTHGDHVLINVKGVFPENMEHVKVFVTPHESDDFDAIPETCTEVQMTLDRDIMSGVYDSAIDSFNKAGDVDILFTYDGEIVYHVTLDRFR